MRLQELDAPRFVLFIRGRLVSTAGLGVDRDHALVRQPHDEIGRRRPLPRRASAGFEVAELAHAGQLDAALAVLTPSAIARRQSVREPGGVLHGLQRK
jgi:hypothetical protein